MAPLNNQLVSPECRKLAQDLGFTQYPTSKTAEPYLQYIISKHNDFGTVDDYLWLFSEIIKLSSLATPSSTVPPNIQTIITIFDNDTSNRCFVGRVAPTRTKDVTDTVFLILGLWSMMRMSFETETNQVRPVIWAYNARLNGQVPIIDPLVCSLQDLVEGSGLVPRSSNAQNMPQGIADTLDPNAYYPMSPLTIPARALNLSKLSILAGVHVHWTDNVARHLLLSSHAGTLHVELYAFPCALNSAYRTTAFLEQTGIPTRYMVEVSKSYASLFNPVGVSKIHEFLNLFGAKRFFCWCLACTSYRLGRREFRSLIAEKQTC